MDIEDRKNKAKDTNKAKNKTVYDVKNHFKSTEAQRKRLKNQRQSKPKKAKMFVSAEEEVQAYMAELGLL